MINGFVPVYRDILQDPVFNNPILFRLYMWCILKAYFSPSEDIIGNQKVFVDRGQFIFGRKKCAIELNMKERTLYDRMKALEKCGKIVIESNNKFSLITVVNYGFRESDIDQNQQQNQQQTNNKPTTNQQQTNTNNNINNIKKTNTYSGNRKPKRSFGNFKGRDYENMDELTKALIE